MYEASCVVEERERERARRVAEAALWRARVVALWRFRAKRLRPFLSCLLDSCVACARDAKLPCVVRDLSILRRDVVRAGLQGSRRAASNFKALQRVFLRHRVRIAVLSLDGGKLCCHHIGWKEGPCVGVLFWDELSRHALRVPVPYTVVSFRPYPHTTHFHGLFHVRVGSGPQASLKRKG